MMTTLLSHGECNGSRRVKYLTVLVMIIPVTIVMFLFSTKTPWMGSYRTVVCSDVRSDDGHMRSSGSQLMGEECQWYFLNYTPSVWESTWYEQISTLQGDVCGNLAKPENLNKTILLMQRLISLQKFGRNESNNGEDISDTLLSRMFYRQRCLDPRTGQYSDVREVSHTIEPLIGLLRDPFTVCSPLDASLVPPSLYEGAILLSRRFLLLSVAAPYSMSSTVKFSSHQYSQSNIPPWMYDRAKRNRPKRQNDSREKKIILLDLGSSYFGAPNVDISDTSTRWLYEHYKHFGVQFDRIIAYEAAALDAKTAWEQLPEDVFPVYTFINTGCTETGILNPWKTLQRLAKEEDHVVVKVDIDTFDLENLLMNQALNDPKIYSLIDELFFEHHVSVKEMLAYWRPPPGSLQDSYVLFTKLRQLGIRMHSWP